METVTQVLNFLAENSEWFVGAGALTLVAGAESFIMTFVTKRFGERRTELFKIMSVVAFMLVTSALAYLATATALHPVFVPLAAAARYVLAQPFYIRAWKPLYEKAQTYIADALAYRESQAPVVSTPEPVSFDH